MISSYAIETIQDNNLISLFITVLYDAHQMDGLKHYDLPSKTQTIVSQTTREKHKKQGGKT